MSLWKIAWRSLQQRGFSSFLTGASVALGVTLMVAILIAGQNVRSAYESGPTLNHNCLIGPKGSATQLVMNTVYHIDTPIKQTLPWTYYQEFLGKYQRPDQKPGKYSDYVERAIPVCKGDAFQDAQVVATTPDFFKTPTGLKKELFEFADGQCFQTPDFFTGVVGATAAKQLNLGVGSKFRPSHAAPTDGQDHSECDHDEFTIVGVLKPTGTPNDRAIFINIEGFFLQEGHVNLDKLDPAVAEKMKSHAHVHVHKNGEKCDHDHHDPLPDELRQVSAILLQTTAGMGLPPELVHNRLSNRSTTLTTRRRSRRPRFRRSSRATSSDRSCGC
ncbi:MAG: ABC transporter permease [Pirellulales bacterium]